MKRLVLLAAAALLAPAGSATAATARHHARSAFYRPPTLVTRYGSHDAPVGGAWGRWLAQARVPLPGGRVYVFTDVVQPGQPGAYSGMDYCQAEVTCTEWLGGSQVVVPGPFYGLTLDYATDGYRPRYVLYHELGHVFDWTHLTRADRRWLERLMGARGEVWDENSDPRGGAMDEFADDYAFCAENYRPGWSPWWWPGGASDLRDETAICRTIVGAGRRTGSIPVPAYVP